MNKYIILGKTLALYQEILRIKNKITIAKKHEAVFWGNPEANILNTELKEIGRRYGKLKCYLNKNHPELNPTLRSEEKKIHKKINNIDKDKALKLLEESNQVISSIKIKTSPEKITQYYYDKDAKQEFFNQNKERFQEINRVLEYFSIKKINYNIMPKKINNIGTYLNSVVFDLNKATR